MWSCPDANTSHQATEPSRHRVINAQGGISISKVGLPPELQKALLEREGVEFGADGRVDLDRWGWIGPRRAASRE